MTSQEQPKNASFVKSIARRFFILWIVVVLVVILMVVLAYLNVRTARQYIVDSPQDIAQVVESTPRTAIVFGSAVDPLGQPRSVLQSRLDTAADLYEQALIDELILSGYASSDGNYNEPAAMKNYMKQVHAIEGSSIVIDTQGDSTYDTCQQASLNSLEEEQVLLITQVGHLDRAIFLCRHHGIDAFGYPAPSNAYSFNGLYQVVREGFSNVKAVARTLW